MLTASSSSGIGNDAMVAVLSLAAIVPPIVLLALLGTTAREPGTDHEGAMP
jgi:putative spermidine/putrescine transport system permease protein